MTIEEYFGKWFKVLDIDELNKILKWIKILDPNSICPSISNIFKAFNLCTYEECKVIFIGQDPYSDKYLKQPRATGILFGNDNKITEDYISPSLTVIKNSVINFEIPHKSITFDNSLESWAKQGILMLNSALTCEVGKPGSHSLKWIPFIANLLKNLSLNNTALIYVLFGKQAQSFRRFINSRSNYILEVNHPSYYARTNTSMPSNIFEEVNRILYGLYNDKIKWFNEII